MPKVECLDFRRLALGMLLVTSFDLLLFGAPGAGGQLGWGRPFPDSRAGRRRMADDQGGAPPEDGGGRRKGRRRREAEAVQELPPLRVPKAAESLRRDMDGSTGQGGETGDAAVAAAGGGRRQRRAKNTEVKREGADVPAATTGGDPAPAKLEVTGDVLKSSGSEGAAPAGDAGEGQKRASPEGGRGNGSPSGSISEPAGGNPSPNEEITEAGNIGGGGVFAPEDPHEGRSGARADEGGRGAQIAQPVVVGGMTGELWGGERRRDSLDRGGHREGMFKCPGTRNRGRAPSVMFRRVFLGLLVAVIVVVITLMSRQQPKTPTLDR